ncbi:MAG: MgtC/SapB family protein [Candidatus Syntropharchaeales archaeon]
MDTVLILDAIMKLLLSIILGGAIGFEREIKHHPAGFRTYILVCLGSTIMMFISYYPWQTGAGGIALVMDTSRVAAGIITGIGFLGAGAILREGISVKGLTTAAGLWVTAGVGILVGVGMMELAIISTVAILITLSGFSQFEERLSFPQVRRILHVRMADIPDERTMVESLLESCRLKFEMNSFLHEKGEISFTYTVAMPRNFDIVPITAEMLKDERILEVRWT